MVRSDDRKAVAGIAQVFIGFEEGERSRVVDGGGDTGGESERRDAMGERQLQCVV